MTREDLITVDLRTTNYYRRRPCLFCGGHSDKDAVNAEVSSAVLDVRPGQTGSAVTGWIVCRRCLQADAAEVRAQLREHAAWHRERAGELEAIAADLPPLPTLAQVEQLEQQHEQEWAQERHALRSPVNPEHWPF